MEASSKALDEGGVSAEDMDRYVETYPQMRESMQEMSRHEAGRKSAAPAGE